MSIADLGSDEYIILWGLSAHNQKYISAVPYHTSSIIWFVIASNTEVKGELNLLHINHPGPPRTPFLG